MTLPPVPLIVIVDVPVVAVLDTVRVNLDVPEPGAAIGFGLKLPVTPEENPVALRVIGALNPPETVVVTVT